MSNKLNDLLEKYPFLSFVKYGGREYICIIQNQDQNITTIFDIARCKSKQELHDFLKLADTWWWESNRMIPIDIFLKGDWEPFGHTLLTFNNKDVEIVQGHIVDLNQIATKRIKRRSIQLVKRVN